MGNIFFWGIVSNKSGDKKSKLNIFVLLVSDRKASSVVVVVVNVVVVDVVIGVIVIVVVEVFVVTVVVARCLIFTFRAYIFLHCRRRGILKSCGIVACREAKILSPSLHWYMYRISDSASYC